MKRTTSTGGTYDLATLKDRADLVAEVADRTGHPGKYAGATVTFPCPNPSHADRHPSFTVNTSTGRWKCWSQCGRGGDVIELVEWLDGLNTGEAIRYLAGRYGLTADTSRADTRRRAPKAPPAPKPPAVVTRPDDTSRPHPDPEEAARILDTFCEGRKWSAKTAAAVGLSVVLDRDGKPRVRFPFLRGGELLLWQDRATLEGQGPKWITPAGAVLYPFGLDGLEAFGGNLDDCPPCPIIGVPAVWIVEGPADAVTLLNLWPTLTVLGLPGTPSWKAHYAEALQGLPVVVIMDNDDPGRKVRAAITADLHTAGAVPLNVEVPADYNDLSEWYAAAGWRTFATDFLDLTEAAEDAALTEEVAS
jgi:hypothetical protein